MNKKILFLGAILVIVYIIYKGLNLFYYTNLNKQYLDYIDNFQKSGEIIKVEYKENSTDKFDNVSFKKPENYTFDLEKSSISELEKINVFASNDGNNFIRVGKSSYGLYEIFNSTDYDIFNNYSVKVDTKSLFEKYDINNTLDLLKYTINNVNKSVNVFDSVEEYQMNHLIKTHVILAIPNSVIYFVEGSVTGYVYEIDKYYEVHVINNSEEYIFGFYSKDNTLNKDYVVEFLSSIKVN